MEEEGGRGRRVVELHGTGRGGGAAEVRRRVEVVGWGTEHGDGRGVFALLGWWGLAIVRIGGARIVWDVQFRDARHLIVQG